MCPGRIASSARIVAGLGAALAAAMPLAAQHRGFPVAADVAVRIHNLEGETRVSGWDRDSIDAVATIPPGGGQFYGGGSRSGAKLGIESRAPGSATGATLVVRVPHTARVWVKSASARVDVRDVRGEVEVSTVTGPVDLAGEPRVATLETIDGDVLVEGAATVLRVRTGAGDVRVRGARGDVAVTTVQGSVTIASLDLLSARIESVSGAVDVSGALSATGRLEAQTHDGDVTLTLHRPLDARFDLESVSGRVITRLADGPERAHPAGVAKLAVGSKAAGSRSASVTVRTFKGTIRVRSNPAP